MKNINRINPLVYLFTLGHFATDWSQGAIPALLPYFIAVCHLNYQDAASLIFANILLASISQPIFGYYSDKVSKPWFVSAGPVICGLTLAVIAFTTNYWVIFVCSMLSGLGSSIFHPEAALMVNKISGKYKGQALASFSVGGNVGFAVGPLVAGLCAYEFDIHGLVLFGIINVLLAGILYYYMPQVLAQAATAETAEKKAHPVDSRRNDWFSFGKLSIAIAVRSLAFKITNSFIPIFWITELHASASTGSLALTILFSIGAVFTYVGGLMADRMGFVRVMRMSFLIMVPAMFFLTHSQNIWVAMLLLVPVAFSIFTPYSPIVVLGQTYLAKNVGFASGVTMGLGTTLGGLMAPVVGRAADFWGMGAALQILWVAAIFGAVASFLVSEPKAEATK